MKSFRQHLNEASQNLHMEHIDDEVLNGGIDGTRKAINFLRNLRDLLAGHSKSPIDVTVKWDGAPAIFAGINPDNGRFFVGTKSVFNKVTPKINYTEEDIDNNHSSKGLNQKLKIALQEFPKLGIKGVIQGDILFTKSDLKTKTISNEKLLTFQPNTILYAVPNNSGLAREIRSSKIGVVFHTTYTGNKLSSMSANFGFNVETLNTVNSVWAQDAMFKDESGMATMTDKQTAKVTSLLSEIGKLFRQMDSSFVNMVAEDEKLRMLIKTFNNVKIRKGRTISNPSAHAKQLSRFIHDRYQKEIDKLKTSKGKNRRLDELKSIQKILDDNKKQFVIIFEMQKRLRDVKLMLIRQLEKVHSLGTFIETENGFKVTAPEGFVAIDHLTGSAVKIVDRLEFSKANFNLNKNWSK